MQPAIENSFSISTNKEKLNIEYIHHYLSTQAYWSQNIPREVVVKSIRGSLCFGVYHHQQQIGFARVITDGATFGYLADVFIDEYFRGRGLSKMLMKEILAHPDLTGLRRIMLGTRDAHRLYEQFGFSVLPDTAPWMQLHKPDVYKTPA